MSEGTPIPGPFIKPTVYFERSTIAKSVLTATPCIDIVRRRGRADRMRPQEGRHLPVRSMLMAAGYPPLDVLSKIDPNCGNYHLDIIRRLWCSAPRKGERHVRPIKSDLSRRG